MPVVQSGICNEIFRIFEHLPILGVCLGHQILGVLHGAETVRAHEPVHGRLSDISHDGHTLFQGIPSGRNSGFEVVRYLQSLQIKHCSCNFVG